MIDNSSHQPKEYDVVLGGQAITPGNSAILGGIEGVKKRLASNIIEEKIAAIPEALKYGEAGLNLVIKILNDPSFRVQHEGYLLLRDRKEKTVKQALKNYIPLITNSGIDYRLLASLLAEGKWQEADEETLAVILKVSDRENEGWIEETEIYKFPTEDLQTIDKLWLKYSQGRFGFSIQKQIWQNVGGKPGIIDWKAWGQFGYRVGWRNYEFWTHYQDLQFNLNSPQGHLPGWIGWGEKIGDADFLMFGGGELIFFQRWSAMLSHQDL